MAIPSKRERLTEFLRRLKAAPLATNTEEARQQLTDILNAVEDEYTNIPYDPAAWQHDGRLYPPFTDSIRTVPNRPDLTRYVHLGHETFFGAKGAILIRDRRRKTVELSKPGIDGEEIRDV